MSIRRLFIAVIVFCSCLFLPNASAKQPVILWKTQTYSYTARQAAVGDILTDFASAQGIGINLQGDMKMRLNGDFRQLSPQQFLEKICGMANLVWYYDGAGLYICSPTHMTSTLLALRYMKASDVIRLLRELEVEDDRFPIAKSANDELIKVSGPPRYVSLILELVQKADMLRLKRMSTAESIRVFPLKHAWADDKTLSITGSASGSSTVPGVVSILSRLMGYNGTDGTSSNRKRQLPGDPGAKKDSSQMTADDKVKQDIWNNQENSPAILADTRLNAVIIRDVESRMPYYEELIKTLDVPVRMVEIAVTVLDINQDSMLDWEMRLKAMGGRKKFSGGGALDADNALKPDELAGLGLAGSLTYLRKDISLLVNIAALQEKGKARTVSRPSVITLDNVAAELQDTKSYRAKVVGTEVVELTEVTAGIVLSVQPRIVDLPPVKQKPGEPPAPTYEIWMLMKIQDGGFESIAVDNLPMTRTSTLETQAGVQEGQCLLVGGYVHEIEEDRTWGIPFLRDIPYIGFLFGGVAKEKSMVQRMFLLAPRVITFGTEDAHPTRGAIRMRDMKTEAEIEDAIHADNYRRNKYDKERAERRKLEEEDWRQDRIDQAKEKVDDKKAQNLERLDMMIQDEEDRRQMLRQKQQELRRQAQLEQDRRDMEINLKKARREAEEKAKEAAKEAAAKKAEKAEEAVTKKATMDQDLKVLQEERSKQAQTLQRKQAQVKSVPQARREVPADRQAAQHLKQQQQEQETIKQALEESKKK